MLDASITLAWSFEDERTPPVDAVLDQISDFGAVAPQLWPLEVANTLRLAARRGRIPLDRVAGILSSLTALDIEIDTETVGRAWTTILNIADKHDLTVYDASYLELAIRRGLPLATGDKALVRAARAEAVSVLP
ncbi:type II toxin-antitoxin system VapC family toxin [uncultured Devosia sp.]|uniref:type II toxin-antitoxin system VapC family toxin n=1 Tax=uncultured Devosia sp. TaxID=211434 RepID=UPI0035CA4F46